MPPTEEQGRQARKGTGASARDSGERQMDEDERSQASDGQARRKPPPLQPGLHIVATPIGNLRDITLRALDVLQAADLIVCEDTRVFAKLARHYAIAVPTLAYSDATQDAAEPRVVAALAAGKRVALVSD